MFLCRRYRIALAIQVVHKHFHFLYLYLAYKVVQPGHFYYLCKNSSHLQRVYNSRYHFQVLMTQTNTTDSDRERKLPTSFLTVMKNFGQHKFSQQIIQFSSLIITRASKHFKILELFGYFCHLNLNIQNKRQYKSFRW